MSKVLLVLFGGLGKNTHYTNKYSLARTLIKQSLDFAKTDSEIGLSIMSIGLSFKFQKKYKKSIEYYYRSLDVLKDNLNRSTVFNNLAEVYNLLGKTEKALYLINLAFENVDDTYVSKLFIYYQTYAQIKLSQGKLDDAIAKLYELTMNIKDIFTFKQVIIDGINTIISYGKAANNVTLLKNIEALIMDLVEHINKDCNNYSKELLSCIGDIRFFMKDAYNI